MLPDDSSDNSVVLILTGWLAQWLVSLKNTNLHQLGNFCCLFNVVFVMWSGLHLGFLCRSVSDVLCSHQGQGLNLNDAVILHYLSSDKLIYVRLDLNKGLSKPVDLLNLERPGLYFTHTLMELHFSYCFFYKNPQG